MYTFPMGKISYTSMKIILEPVKIIPEPVKTYWFWYNFDTGL